jgi:hypothetical protein
MQWLRCVPSRRIDLAVLAAVVLACATPALAQAPPVWGDLPLPGGSTAAREALLLGDPDGRLESTILLDFVRRYANSDLRTAADRFERHLLAVQKAAPTDAQPPRASVLPLPLPGFWQDTFGAADTPLIVAMLRSRSALLTYHGLMALDATTLERLSARPAVLRGFLTSGVSSAAFATFGQSLRVNADGVVTPGGESDRSVWQHLVGQSPTDVEPFIAALFQRDDGRLAWFYETVSGLPDATRRFVLAADRPVAERLSAVEAVYRRFAAADPTWQIDARPFHRPAFDGALALMVLEPRDGRIGPDWWPAVFDDVTRHVDWSAPRPPGTATAPDRPTDATWLFDWVFAVPEQARARFTAVRFAQRVFGSAPRDTAPHLHAALGGVLEMPVLMLSIERMGVRDPDTMSAIARAARAATHAGGEGRVLPVLARWQAALGLLEQVQRRVALPEARISALVRTLAAIAPIDTDAASGSVAAWLHDHLLPALGVENAASPELEDAFLRAATTPRLPARPSFTWEGLPYVIDAPAAAQKSATTIRRAITAPRLQELVELHRVRLAIERGGASLGPAAARELVVRLERLAPLVALIDHREDRRIRDFARVIETVGGTTGAQLTRQVPAISAALDAVTDAVVPSLLYALAISPTAEPILYPEAWTRHSLQQPGGLPVSASRQWRDVAWQFPTDYGFGGGTRLVGAYLAVDVALADSQLVRVMSGALPVPGVVEDAMRRGLVEPVVLADPQAPHGIPPRQLADLAAGRQLIATWTTDRPADDVIAASLRAASVDAWRANVIAWEVASSRPAALRSLTITELAWLGSTTTKHDDDAMGWSGSARLVDGCLCRLQARRVTHEQMRGRRLGVQALRPHDITLRLAELVASIDLDIALVPAMLPIALQDWLDRSRPAWSDDWEAFTSWPHALTAERVEEYLLHLVSAGVFSPPATEESPR